MIKRNFNLERAMDVALYGRMSTDGQNDRSPDQQFIEIREAVARRNLPWNVVAEFRDDGISGRLVRKRPGLMNLVHQIKTGQLNVGAILVHTLERWGRADDMAKIRHELQKKFGVLVLTCDSSFADPTSVAGQALGFIEQLRSTGAAPIKAFEVFRGKKDAVNLKHWPGGPPPFGYKLKYTTTRKNGKPEVDFATLEPDPEKAWIIRRIFDLAITNGWGTTRIAKWLNSEPQTCKLKRFYSSTVGYWLDQPIYYGELLWAEHSTDIVDDVRVIQRNDVQDHIRVPDFCEPLITRQDWDQAQELRQLRRRARQNVKKQYGYQPGRVLKLMLTGLVRCHECEASMQPSAGGCAGKAVQKYRYYVCPRYRSGACANKTSVREDALLRVVIATLRQKLFPLGDCKSEPIWLADLFERVRQELGKLAAQTPDRGESLRQRIKLAQDQMQGWVQSLGDPNLPQQLRDELTRQYKAKAQECTTIQAQLHQLDQMEQTTADLLNPDDVMRHLKHLDDALAGSNPTLANVELSRHIDRIDVHADGRILLHACRLGVLDGAVRMLSGHDPSCDDGQLEPISSAAAIEPPVRGLSKVASRSRPRLRVDEDALSDSGDLVRASDLKLFRGLDPAWYWVDELTIPKTNSWSEGHAAEVATLWAADPRKWVIPKLAAHFGVSTVTARKALRMGQAAAGMQVPKRQAAPKGVQDARIIADEVAALYLTHLPRMSIRQIASRYKVNQITISKALDHWYRKRNLTRPDGRATRSHRSMPAPDSGPLDPASAPGGAPPQVAASMSARQVTCHACGDRASADA